jgi:inorganic pyrophosphatase
MPAGSTKRIEYDPATDTFGPDKIIPAIPINYGWVPESISADDEAADVMVMGPVLKTGAVVLARPIALFWRVNRDHKVLAVPVLWSADRVDPDPSLVSTLTSWFRRNPGDHWHGRQSALRFLRVCRQKYINRQQ